jgi:hypothetical protein
MLEAVPLGRRAMSLRNNRSCAAALLLSPCSHSAHTIRLARERGGARGNAHVLLCIEQQRDVLGVDIPHSSSSATVFEDVEELTDVARSQLRLRQQRRSG